MKYFIGFLVLLLTLPLLAQKPGADEILAEGKLLYRLEKASWYGTDFFLANFPDQREAIGGYLSYEAENKQVVNIFFSREDPDQILARMYFAEIPEEYPVKVDKEKSTATEAEKALIGMRQATIQALTENKGEFFSFYEHTNPNPIPLISGSERKVYILTGPQMGGVLLLGNDYLLTFDKKNKLKKRKKIHNSLIQFPYGEELKEGEKQDVGMHSHVVSECIDPTDICTLLLYKDYTDWTQHIVMSEKYVSMFDIQKEELVILTRKAWEKISQQVEEMDK